MNLDTSCSPLAKVQVRDMREHEKGIRARHDHMLIKCYALCVVLKHGRHFHPMSLHGVAGTVHVQNGGSIVAWLHISPTCDVHTPRAHLETA